MKKKQQFTEAFTDYLHQADLYTIDEESTSDEYRHIFGYKTFHIEDDSRPYHCLVATKAWLEFLIQIDEIFESKINAKLVNRTMSLKVSELGKLPLSDKLINQYCDQVFETLKRHFELSVEAIIPLYNIGCQSNIEMPLANAVLYSGDSNSLLANKSLHPDTLSDLSEIRDKSFLCIPVTGDEESRLAQVELQSEQALKILRFVTFWQTTTKGNQQKRFNPAHFVSLWKTETRRILYHNPNEPTSRPGVYGDIQRRLVIQPQVVDIARDYLSLDDINYHYQNTDNPNSDRVVRSLELYDSGTQSLTNWQALYRYVASINVSLPTSSSRGDELAEQLETLIKYGGNYVGTMKKDETLSDPDTTNWEGLVRKTAEPFAEFYKLRGKILHGNQMSDDEISDSDVEDARVLAHNAVRLLAKVSRELNWQTYKDAKNWFKEPSYPPSVELPDEN